jgi:hypothetical protein
MTEFVKPHDLMKLVAVFGDNYDNLSSELSITTEV